MNHWTQLYLEDTYLRFITVTGLGSVVLESKCPNFLGLEKLFVRLQARRKALRGEARLPKDDSRYNLHRQADRNMKKEYCLALNVSRAERLDGQ
jgi:hypothetical protein